MVVWNDCDTLGCERRWTSRVRNPIAFSIQATRCWRLRTRVEVKSLDIMNKAMIDIKLSLFVNFITITITFINRITYKTIGWITCAFCHKAFRTVTVHDEKIAKTFKSPLTPFACNKIVPVTFSRTGARITATRKTPTRCLQGGTVTLESTSTACTWKGIGSRRGRSKWVHLNII